MVRGWSSFVTWFLNKHLIILILSSIFIYFPMFISVSHGFCQPFCPVPRVFPGFLPIVSETSARWRGLGGPGSAPGGDRRGGDGRGPTGWSLESAREGGMVGFKERCGYAMICFYAIYNIYIYDIIWYMIWYDIIYIYISNLVNIYVICIFKRAWEI